MKLDLDFVRAQFPAFAEPSLQGQLFFENAGGSYACQQTIHRLTRFYTERKVQPYGSFEASRLGGVEMDEARMRLAAMMGVATDELSFGPSTTQNVYVLAQAFKEMLSDGDAIIVTNQDHEANTGAWRKLADRGIEVREWQIDPDTGMLDVVDLENLLDTKVKLVCFPHCSNVVGHINSVAEICTIVKQAGAYTCVDGVSYAPHGLPNVADLGADIYMFSTYKTYGPHQGVMVVRSDVGWALPNQAHHFNAGTLYKRFTPAGPDHAQVAACAGIADYFDALHDHHFAATVDAKARASAVHDLMRAHEVELAKPLLSYLQNRNDLRVLGPTESAVRAPTIAVDTVKDPFEVAKDLSKHGIMAGASDFYAVRPLAALGVDPDRGVLRLSFVHYTCAADIDRLMDALDQTL